jgi:ribose transport system substrate-binding protein
MTSTTGRGRRGLVAVVLLAGLAASCASGSEGTADEGPDGTDGPATTATVTDAPLAGEEAVAAATERLAPWIEGTMRPPPDDGPPAAEDIEIYVVSCGQLLESCTILVDGVMEGAEEAGWDATLVDTALDFSAAGGAIRQAMAAGADGAIVVGVDCQHFAGALDEANAADFPVVVLNGFDCDVTSDGAEPARFSAQVDFTEGDEDPVANARRFAAAKVDWGVIETGGDLQVINMIQDDLLASQLLGEGFADGVTTCSSCSVVDTITFSTSDLLDGTFPQKVAQAIVEHPEANAIHFPYAATISLGIAGLADAGGEDLLVLGGEGSPSQYELLADGTVDMLMAFDTAWTGWAAVDTLNRILAGVETVDEGVGYQLVTAEDMAGREDYEGPFDYRAVYREVWGA